MSPFAVKAGERDDCFKVIILGPVYHFCTANDHAAEEP